MTNACLDGLLEIFPKVLVGGRTLIAEIAFIPLVSEWTLQNGCHFDAKVVGARSPSNFGH